jgi:signal transduction histidine kinase
MTGVLASPPARPFDVRAAESPLVAMRFHLDSRIADLVQVLDRIQEEHSLTAERAQRLRTFFRRNHEARRELLTSVQRQAPVAVRRCLEDGIEMAAELGRLDERLGGLGRLGSALRREHAVLTELRSRLGAAAARREVELDGRASSYSRATRRLQRLAGEQHSQMEDALVEGPLQGLSDAVLDAEVAARAGLDRESAREKLARCRAATLAAQADVERLLRSCRPLGPGTTLVAAARMLLDDGPGVPAAQLRVIGGERPLPPGVELAAYRILEEGVDNALSHARASRVEVVIAFLRDRLALIVRDDGDGFDVVATRARLGRSEGFGLIAMTTRAQMAGGQVDVRSVLGEGTELRATLPLPAASA